ncbi:MAG: amidohydrolase, partial [Gemmatimonadaceae bacterium]
MTRSIARTLAIAGLALTVPLSLAAQRPSSSAADSLKYVYPSSPALDALKADAVKRVDAKAKLVQQMVDQVYSFGELGMQEFETSKYLTGILEQNGFKVERGVGGMPTAWVARWGSGKPVISLGS